MEKLNQNTSTLEQILDAVNELPEIDKSKQLITTVTGDGYVHLADISEVPHDITIQAAAGTKVTVVKNNLFDIDNFTMEMVSYTPAPTGWERLDKGIKLYSETSGWCSLGAYIDNISKLKGSNLVLGANMLPSLPVTEGAILLYTANEAGTQTKLFELIASGEAKKEFVLPENNDGIKFRMLFYASRGESVTNNDRNETIYENIYLARKEDVTEYTVGSNGFLNIGYNDKVTIIADNTITVTYNKSYGEYMARKSFWENLLYRANGTAHQYTRIFSYQWSRKTFKPVIDIMLSGDSSYAFSAWVFSDRELVNLKGIFKRLGVQFDISQCTKVEGMFDYAMAIGYIPELNVTGCTTESSTRNLFSYAEYLREIDKIIVNENTYYKGWFDSCEKLREVRFEGTIAKGGMNLQWSTKLSRASIESVINALSSTTSGLTVTFSKTAVNNAFTTAEWNALAATKSNWTISLV